MSKKFLSVPHLFGISMLTLTFALAACNKPAAPDATASGAALDPGSAALPPLPPLPDVQPMVAGPAAPLRRAPAAAALPRARMLGYASPSDRDRYAWIDRANRINDTIGDAPPDYGFDYQDGVSPYGWETAGGYRTYAEPIDGGYRTYYYDPGADEPYLVRDPSYSYGYSGGRVVTVYDGSGRVLDAYQAQRQSDYASRYYERARSLRAAANARQRRGVVASGWADHREVISTQRAEWNRTQQNNPEWRAYRGDHGAENQQLADERAARAQAARKFATWQSQAFRGQAPALYDQPRGGFDAQRSGRGDGNGDRVRQQAQDQQAQLQQAQRAQQVQQAQAQQAQQAHAQQAQAQQVQQAQAQQAQQAHAQQAQAQQAQQAHAQQAQQVQAQQVQAQQVQAQRVQAQQVQAQQVQAQRAQAQRAQAQQDKAQQQAQKQAQKQAEQQRAQQQQVQQQQAVKVRAQQQQRVAAQSEQARAARQSQMAARQQGLAAEAERGRVARERQVVASQQAVQQRVAAQRQQAQAAAAQRAAIAQPNPARLVSPVVAPPKPQEQPRPQRQPQPLQVTPQRPAPDSGPRGEHDKEHSRPNPG